jgi:hypothetical protein
MMEHAISLLGDPVNAGATSGGRGVRLSANGLSIIVGGIRRLFWID